MTQTNKSASLPERGTKMWMYTTMDRWHFIWFILSDLEVTKLYSESISPNPLIVNIFKCVKFSHAKPGVKGVIIGTCTTGIHKCMTL